MDIFFADFNTIIAIFMAKSSPKKPQIRQFWLLVELVALNGWIWVGYIQDGLLVPFGPIKIVPGVNTPDPTDEIKPLVSLE